MGIDSRPIHSIWMNGRSIERDAALPPAWDHSRKQLLLITARRSWSEEAAGWLGKALASWAKTARQLPQAAGLNFLTWPGGWSPLSMGG
jgi:hypothetical protein